MSNQELNEAEMNLDDIMGENMTALYGTVHLFGADAHILQCMDGLLHGAFALQVGKLPQTCQQSLLRPFDQGIPILTAEDQHRLFFGSALLFGAFDGKLLRCPPLKAKAELPAGAGLALGRCIRAAESSPQLHQRLGKVPGIGRIKFLQQPGKVPAKSRVIHIAVVIGKP